MRTLKSDQSSRQDKQKFALWGAEPKEFLRGIEQVSDRRYSLDITYRALNNQIEKTCWPLLQFIEVNDFLDRSMYLSNIDFVWILSNGARKESKFKNF